MDTQTKIRRYKDAGIQRNTKRKKQRDKDTGKQRDRRCNGDTDKVADRENNLRNRFLKFVDQIWDKSDFELTHKQASVWILVRI